MAKKATFSQKCKKCDLLDKANLSSTTSRQMIELERRSNSLEMREVMQIRFKELG